MQKPHLLAVTKSDMLDDELIAEMKKEIPGNIPYIFISSVAQKGIQELKDKLWSVINSEA
jgi:GTP-binding protein